MIIAELFTETAAWQKKSGKNKNGGLNKKGVASYRREHPGSKLQTAVTKKPSKIKKGSKDDKRRKSFCARMRGMKKHNTSAKTKNDPNSRINKSLRKWHCESVEELQELLMIAESVVNESKNTAFVKQHISWVAEQLGIKKLPKIVILDEPIEKTFGTYSPDEKTITLVVGGRHPIDVLRTLAHELTHYKQDTEDNLPPGAGETGTDQENEANANAGITMRDFADQNPEYFGLEGEQAVDEHIVKHGSGYRLLSHKGKNLGTFKSKAAAAKHEGEVEYFKHKK